VSIGERASEHSALPSSLCGRERLVTDLDNSCIMQHATRASCPHRRHSMPLRSSFPVSSVFLHAARSRSRSIVFIIALPRELTLYGCHRSSLIIRRIIVGSRPIRSGFVSLSFSLSLSHSGAPRPRRKNPFQRRSRLFAEEFTRSRGTSVKRSRNDPFHAKRFASVSTSSIGRCPYYRNGFQVDVPRNAV